jgi:hypothetical protein
VRSGVKIANDSASAATIPTSVADARALFIMCRIISFGVTSISTIHSSTTAQ